CQGRSDATSGADGAPLGASIVLRPVLERLGADGNHRSAHRYGMDHGGAKNRLRLPHDEAHGCHPDSYNQRINSYQPSIAENCEQAGAAPGAIVITTE